jgi:hypothetical protein
VSWWLGIPPAEALVDCGGADHRLRWEAGTLRALDHGDPEAERTLAALAGEPCVCVERLEAWQRHADDLRVLVLGPRAPRDRAADEEAFGWVPYGPAGAFQPPAADEEDGLVPLLRLEGELPARLVATVAAAWLERPPGAAAARLHAALYGRAAAALEAWLGAEPADVRLGAPPALTRSGDTVAATLPLAWLVRVWARGLATVAGRFCLDAATDDGCTFRLTTVAPDLGAPQPATLSLPAVDPAA